VLKTRICVTRPQCVNKHHNRYKPSWWVISPKQRRLLDNTPTHKIQRVHTPPHPTSCRSTLILTEKWINTFKHLLTRDQTHTLHCHIFAIFPKYGNHKEQVRTVHYAKYDQHVHTHICNSGNWPTWCIISSIICLFESSTCFEQLCAHPQEENCIHTTSGIITLKTIEWSVLVAVRHAGQYGT